MVICVKMGSSLLTDGLVNFDFGEDANVMTKVICISIANAITPLVISGLVKGADSMISRLY